MIKIEKMDDFTKKKKYPPTPAQWQAIALTGADVLVAAAAGSGKTEVLSERIARKVALDRWDIDKLLVLTFTTAAAKNMLVRVENKITERLLASGLEEDRLFLRKQSMLMNDAYVSTIDSFCLNILRKFYYLVEEKIAGSKKYLSPNFNILPNSKNMLINSANEVLERFARENKIITDELFTIFGDKKNIIDSLIDTYYKLLTIPNFEQYLKDTFLKNNNLLLHDFLLNNGIVIDDFSELVELITKESLNTARKFAIHVKNFLVKKDNGNIVERYLSKSLLVDNKKEKIRKYFIENDVNISTSILEQEQCLDNIINSLDNELNKNDNVYDATLLNNIFNDLNNYYSMFQTAKKLDTFSTAYQTTLLELHNEFLKRKRELNFLDFSDLNHLAIKALTKIENGKIVLSEAAEYYRNHFLEIYVDEYQDNNNLQEYILNLIKGENIKFFRVGDVKQAIYGFRGSNPDLFEEKYNSYKQLDIKNYDANIDYAISDEAEGVCVVLKENFRSDENILKSSNYVFNRLMGGKNAGVSYDEQSALYYPSVKEKQVNVIPTQLINGKINYFTKEKLVDKKEYRVQSIENIAYEILNGVKNGKNYSDYAILVRNSTKMTTYKQIFSKYNIPLFFKEKVGFTTSNCFNILYNLFRFLDNTTRDASLIALLHSEIFDYSNDELLNLSLNNGKTLFEKLALSNSVKSKNTVNLLNKWLDFSLNNSLSDILERIVSDIDFVNYLVTIDINDDEVDYYENFIDLVQEYENTDNKLSGFVQYLKNIKDDEVFETKKRTPNNSVTLSTIHISKGLEYKEVFVADLDTSFNKKGYSGEVLFTENFGFSINIDNFIQKYNILLQDKDYFESLYKLNSILIKLREREEEVRNLYVALTRAEKILYLVSPNGIELQNEKAADKSIYQALLEEDNFEKILNNVLSNYGEFLFENEREANITEYSLTEEKDEQKYVDTDFDLSDFYKKFKIKHQELDNSEKSIEVQNKIFPAKTSYSSLKKINNNYESHDSKTKEKNYLKLSTLNKTSANKAILKGNVIHKLFERIINDIRNNIKIEDVNSYLDSLIKTGSLLTDIKEKRILIEDDYKLIDNDIDNERISNFITNDFMDKIRVAQNCQAEVTFTTMQKASELYNDSMSESEVILQGIVDLLVREDENNAFIVDYKTDNVVGKDAEKILIERHKEQLKIYKDAVEDYYNLKNVKTYIYSYTLSKLIEVE